MVSQSDSKDDLTREPPLRPVRMRLDPGNLQLGKYRILGEVGRGGMAEVFLAVAQGLSGFNKLVVLKIIRAEVAEDPDARSMFVDEARLAGRLNHPNVVHTLEVSEDAGRPILVMEHLDGQPLSSILRRCQRDEKPMPMAMGLRVLAEALQGLHYAHTLKNFDGTPLRLVHRDVSPQNIFVTFDGQIKVLDFGIAKAAISSSETRAGVMKGKAAFMAPEQVSGESINHRADIYSTGVVLWQLVTGQQWWKGKAQGQILLTVLNGDVPKPSDVCENVDADLEAICLKAMEVDPSKRFQSALEMHDAIEAAIDARSSVSTRDVGAFVANLFKDEREMLSRTLETELKSLSEAGYRTQTGTLSHPHSEDSQSSIRSVNSDASLSGMRLSRRPEKRKGAAVIMAVVGLAILAGATALLLRTPPETVASAEQMSAPSEPSNPPPPALSLEATKPMVPAASCTIAVKAIPSNATISIDGKPMKDNPSTLHVVQDGKVYSIHAHAPGFVPRTVEVAALRDASFVVELEPVRTGGVVPRVLDPKAPEPVVQEQPPASPPEAKPPAEKKEDPKSARDRIKELDTTSPW